MSVEEKRQLRKTLAAARAALTPQQRHWLSFQAVGRLEKSGILADAKVLAVYAALPEEADPAELERLVRWKKQRTAYPRVTDQGLSFAFSLIAGLVSTPPRGIREPRADLPAVPLDEIDVFIVPGLGFGPNGERIGYGKGYYDRTLAAARADGRRPLAIGFGFPQQRVPHIPMGPDDQRLDALVTAEGLVRFSPA